ncbi:conjugative transposon protein TraM [Flavobacterium sp. ZS1P14]|uniref:conjugative transposon protein TraM n=1 Tax=Flavobacterium sp. ZS1P14 TaxID=3401729 RepID=UPI003AADF9BA
MEKKTESLQLLRQRKLLLMAPLLTLPFITLLFWLLGGGKIEAANAQVIEKKGFNIKLPNPILQEDDPLDKMSYYDRATLDSVKLEELIKKDPNYLRHSFLGDSIGIANDSVRDRMGLKKKSGALNTVSYRDPNEEKVYKKLEALQRVINNPPQPPEQQHNFTQYKDQTTTNSDSKDVDRLEQMMQSMNQSDTEDPELQKLNGMLENILDIQHPGRVQEKLRKTSDANKGKVFTIAATGKEDAITFLQNAKNPNAEGSGIQPNHNAFFSFEESLDAAAMPNAIEAVVHENQTLVNGATVKLRLTTAIFINGLMIPKDNFLFGVATLQGERLTIKINSLRYGNSLFPVDLSVYDMDGLEGIYIPGAITRDVAKASADRSMQTLGITALDDSWGAQAAGAGIEAVKNLLSKKVKLVKVMVKAGYQVLIHDENQKENNSN